MKTPVLSSLPDAALISLGSALRRGLFDQGSNLAALQQSVGPAAGVVGGEIEVLFTSGFTPWTLSVMVDAILHQRSQAAGALDLFDLVISGPDVPGIPVSDTGAVFHSIIESAKESLEFVGYAVHNGRALFERLASRMVSSPNLVVSFTVDIARPRGDTLIESGIVYRFARQFWEKQWPWTPRPRLFYDPRSLSMDLTARSAMHAKCVIADGRTAFISSANFTEAAQQRNIEAGVLIRHAPTVARLAGYFRELRGTGMLIEIASI
jgi:hypothetical protein